jgi:hypothetical protein
MLEVSVTAMGVIVGYLIISWIVDSVRSRK